MNAKSGKSESSTVKYWCLVEKLAAIYLLELIIQGVVDEEPKLHHCSGLPPHDSRHDKQLVRDGTLGTNRS